MAGKPRREGYLLIDHTFSPGITPEQLHAVGMPGPAVGADKKGEFATLTCGHCCMVLIKNPLRTRDRSHCHKCDSYICDGCGAAMAASGVCISLDKLFDFVQEENSKLEEQGIAVTQLPDLSPLYSTVSVSVPPTSLDTSRPNKGE